MTSKKSRTRTRTPRTLMFAALAATALGLSGCGDDNENARAIQKASNDLEILAAVHQEGSVPSGTVAQASYEKIVSSLQGAADSDSPGEAAAARVLRARAIIRQGDEAASRVALIERQAREYAARVRSYHDQWLDLTAQADALRKFDASKGLAQSDADIRANGEATEKAKGDLAKAEQELQALQQRAEQAQASSRAQRDKELEIRNQMISKTQTERAELVRQANEARRTGDGFDREAADLMAQMGRQRPLIAELQMRVQRLEAQRLMQGAARKELEAAAARAAQQADRALKGSKDGEFEYVGAQQVSERLAATLGEIKELRAGLNEPGEQASQLYGRALSEVQKAKSAGAGGGGGAAGRGVRGGADTKLTEAAVNHANADLLFVQARGLEAHAALMTMLAETKPALPGASGYQSEAKAASDAAAAKLKESQEAFGRARELYEGAGASEKAQDVKDRLEQIAKSLVVFGGGAAPEGGTPDAGTPDGGTPQGDVATTPPANPDSPTTPAPEPTAANLEGEKAEVHALLQQLADATKAKTPEALLPHIVFRNSQQEESFKKVAPMLAKQEELSQACLERFGRTFFEVAQDFVSQMGGEASDMKQFNSRGQQALMQISSINPDSMEIRITSPGAEAEAVFKGDASGEPLEFMKLDNAWKLKLDFDLPPQQAADAFIQGVLPVYDTIIANIKGGKYGSDANKMVQDFITETIKRTMEILAPKKDENK